MMPVWTSNFPYVLGVLTVMALFVPGRLKLQRFGGILRFLIRMGLGIVIFLVIATFFSIFIHSLEIDVLRAIKDDPIGGLAYFFETGAETTFGWFVGLLSSSIFLLAKERELP